MRAPNPGSDGLGDDLEFDLVDGDFLTRDVRSKPGCLTFTWVVAFQHRRLASTVIVKI